MQPDIELAGLTLDTWRETKKNNPRPIDGQIIKGFYSLSHQHNTIPEAVMARFFLAEQELYRAWGYTNEPHCRFHTILLHDPLTAIKGCPPVAITRQNDLTVLSLGTSLVSNVPITVIN